MKSVLSELKRRHVPRVAVVYAAVTFAVLQAVEIAVPRLGVPDWTITFLLVLGLAGFPIALALSWYFEITPEGVRRHDAAAQTGAAPRWVSGWTVGVVVLALLAGASTAWLAARRSPEEPRSIAVLPFADLSQGKDQEYFADGMAEEILGALSRIEGLRVAGRGSSFAWKGKNADSRAVGRELGVGLILEGSVARDRDDLRIRVNLIDVGTGFQRWSHTYQRRLENVFAIQEDIATAVAGALRVSLGADGAEQLVPHRTADLEAYRLYLEGRSLLKKRYGSIDEAIVLFRQALDRDSTFAPAWAGLAEAHSLSPYYAIPADSVRDYAAFLTRSFVVSLAEGERAARRAIALDPDFAPGHLALGSVLRDRRQWAPAEAEYRRAIALDGAYAEAWVQYGDLLYNTGRVGGAVGAASTAVELDPLVAIYLNYLGFFSTNNGHYDEGIRALERALALDPTFGIARNNLLNAYFAAGRIDEAVALWEEVLKQNGRTLAEALDGTRLDVPTLKVFMRGAADPALRDSAVVLLRDMPASFIADGPEWFPLALGDTALTLTLVEERTLSVPYGTNFIIWDVKLAPLHDHPRYRELIRKLGFDEVPEQVRQAAQRAAARRP